MDRAGPRKQALATKHPVGHTCNDVKIKSFAGRNRRKPVAEIVDLFASAPSATGRHVAEAWSRLRGTTTGLDRDDVELAADRAPVDAVTNADDRNASKQSFGMAEPGRQLEVVARCAHRGGGQRSIELDRHRLLDDQLVGAALRLTSFAEAGHLRDEHALGSTTCHACRLRDRRRDRRRDRQHLSRAGQELLPTRCGPSSAALARVEVERRLDQFELHQH